MSGMEFTSRSSGVTYRFDQIADHAYAACAECNSDDSAEGHIYCSGCLEVLGAEADEDEAKCYTDGRGPGEDRDRPTGRAGICGSRLAPVVGPRLHCELLAGHDGWHEARTFPPDVLSAGLPTQWSGDRP